MASGAASLGSVAVSGATTAGIGAGIQLASSLIMGMLAAHDARVKAAKEENAAVQQSVQAIDADLQTIFAAVNSGEISPQTAQTLCGYLWAWYWQFIQPLQQGGIKGNHCTKTFPYPGTKPAGGDGNCYSDAGNPCSGTDCTAGCCIGCNAIGPSLSRCIYALATTGSQAYICEIVGNKYGLQTRAGYYLTWKMPPSPTTTLQTVINPSTGQVTVGLPGSQGSVVVSSGDVDENGQLLSGQPVGTVQSNAGLAPASWIPGVSNEILVGGIVAFLAALGAGIALRERS